MSRLVAIASLVVVAVLTSSTSAAHAQWTPRTAMLEEPALRVDAARELRGIDGESTAATVLYATGIPLQVLGAGAFVLGGLGALVCAGSESPGCSNTGVAIAVTGMIAFGVGLSEMIVAIVLDVDSGSRRGGWHRRWDGPTPSVAPTPGGATFGLSGSF